MNGYVIHKACAVDENDSDTWQVIAPRGVIIQEFQLLYKNYYGVPIAISLANLLNSETKELRAKNQALETALDVCSKKRQAAQFSFQYIVEQVRPFSDFMHNHPKHIEAASVLTDVAIQWITDLESENKRLLEWGVESEAIYRKESVENKELRQQLADALGADETTEDSLNMEFRHNPDDDAPELPLGTHVYLKRPIRDVPYGTQGELIQIAGRLCFLAFDSPVSAAVPITAKDFDVIPF